ncbi:PAS domain S-box protein [Spirochaetota bacterium]
MNKKRKILLVEDEAIIALSESKIIEKSGYDVVVANSGEKAIKLFKNNPGFDLILMDIDLGKGIDGTETARKILSKHDVPIVFLTGHAEKEMVNKVKGITRYGYIIKESGRFVLIESINMAFELYEENKKTQMNSEELQAANEELQAAIEELEVTNEQLIESENEIIHREIKLTESEKRYRHLFNSLIEGVCLHEIVYDESGKAIDYRILDVNNRYEEILNLKKTDVVGKLASKLYGLNSPPYLDIYTVVAESGNPNEFETYFPPMSKHFLISVFSPEKGKFATVFEDITKQKLVDEKLQQSEDQYRFIIDNSHIGIVINQEGKRIFFNSKSHEILDYSKEEYAKIDFISLIHPDDREKITIKINKYIAGDKLDPDSSEIRLLNKHGDEIWVETTSYMIQWNGKPAMQSYIIDITERKKAEKEIMRLLVEKEMLMKEVHHRIKNDMSTVKSLLSLQQLSSKSPDAVSTLKDAQDRINVMGSIYEMLYKGEKIDIVNMQLYLKNLLSSIKRSHAINALINMTYEIEDFEISSKMAFPIGIIINELVGNSYKYAFHDMSEGQIDIRVSKKDDKSIEIIVSDNGKGIPREIMEKKSFGFGFVLIETYTEQFDGILDISQNNGTVVTVRLFLPDK